MYLYSGLLQSRALNDRQPLEVLIQPRARKQIANAGNDVKNILREWGLNRNLVCALASAGVVFVARVPAAVATAAPARADPSYDVTDLGTFGGDKSSPTGINGSGEVTGYALKPGDLARHAFLYSDSTMRDLGTLRGGTVSTGYGINTKGEVTGESGTSVSSNFHAFLYHGSIMQNLGTLGGTAAVGYGINDSGEVTGYSYTAHNSHKHAFLYKRPAMRDLGTLGGPYSASTGYGINHSDEVTGASTTSGGFQHAFLFNGRTMQDLGTLGGATSVGRAINASGEVTGSADTGQTTHAFLYNGRTMQDLGSLGGPMFRSVGYGINDSGEVVGSSTPSNSAFLYDGKRMVELNTLISPNDPFHGRVHFNRAVGINNSGQIAADGCYLAGTPLAGQCHAFLLTPELSSPALAKPEKSAR